MKKLLTAGKAKLALVLGASLALVGQSALATTAYDGITTAVTQPLTDALTVIVAIAGLLAVLYVGWRVSKMLLSFVRGA